MGRAGGAGHLARRWPCSGEFAGDVYRRDVATAHWIQRNLPPGTAMANLATSVEYLTGHRSLNLHGVTTPDFFGGHAAEREADTFESLRRLAPASRPPYLITTVSAQDRFPIMRELVTGAAPLPLGQLRRRDRDLPDELRPARSREGSGPLHDRRLDRHARARRSAQRL